MKTDDGVLREYASLVAGYDDRWSRDVRLPVQDTIRHY